MLVTADGSNPTWTGPSRVVVCGSILRQAGDGLAGAVELPFCQQIGVLFDESAQAGARRRCLKRF
jgi:hypothetical protein